MKNILDYKNFKKLNEKYEEDPEYRIKNFFNKLEKNIRLWFTEGSFSINDTTLYDIKVNTTNNIDKTLIFDFQDSDYYYQVIVIVSLQEVNENTLEDCFIKVKRYNSDTSELLKEVNKNVLIKELNEDKLMELFSELDNETSYTDEENLSDEDKDSQENVQQTKDTQVQPQPQSQVQSQVQPQTQSQVQTQPPTK